PPSPGHSPRSRSPLRGCCSLGRDPCEPNGPAARRPRLPSVCHPDDCENEKLMRGYRSRRGDASGRAECARPARYECYYFVFRGSFLGGGSFLNIGWFGSPRDNRYAIKSITSSSFSGLSKSSGISDLADGLTSSMSARFTSTSFVESSGSVRIVIPSLVSATIR